MKFSLLACLVGVRKLLITLLFMGILVSLRVTDLINGSEFIDGAKNVLVAYMSTNVGEWIAKGFSEVFKAKFKNEESKASNKGN